MMPSADQNLETALEMHSDMSDFLTFSKLKRGLIKHWCVKEKGGHRCHIKEGEADQKSKTSISHFEYRHATWV